MTDDYALPEAAQAFRTHFTDPLYDDPEGEFAPFGTDEGFDMLHEWAERRGELASTSTLSQLLEESGFDGVEQQLDVPEPAGLGREHGPAKIPVPGGQIDAATIVIGAGFTLLRLTGNLDEQGKRLTLKALEVLIDFYDSPAELLHQREDLSSWA